LISQLPDTPDRARQELALQMTLGLQIQVTRGFAAKDAADAYHRALHLCDQLSEPRSLYPVLWGLFICCKARSELARARELAEKRAGGGSRAQRGSVTTIAVVLPRRPLRGAFGRCVPLKGLSRSYSLKSATDTDHNSSPRTLASVTVDVFASLGASTMPLSAASWLINFLLCTDCLAAQLH
jgi:hypothetical protein